MDEIPLLNFGPPPMPDEAVSLVVRHVGHGPAAELWKACWWSGFATATVAITFILAITAVVLAIRSRKPLALLLLLAIPPAAQAQPPQRETHTDIPVYRGTHANAPIPPDLHWRNQGGSDGAGLCVISSLKINGGYQGVPGLDTMWATAKSRPGGYSPNKLQALLDEVMPSEKWASYVGKDPTVLHKLSKMGYPIGSTMNTGELYSYRPIHHMISLVHFDRERDLACVVDNNQPHVYSWMSSKEYLRRWVDGGTGWAFVWLRKIPALFELTAAIVVLGLLAVAVALNLRRPRPAPAVAPPPAMFTHWASTDD